VAKSHAAGIARRHAPCAAERAYRRYALGAGTGASQIARGWDWIEAAIAAMRRAPRHAHLWRHAPGTAVRRRPGVRTTAGRDGTLRRAGGARKGEELEPEGDGPLATSALLSVRLRIVAGAAGFGGAHDP